LTLLSLQEVVSKTESQRKIIEDQMDRSGRKGGFHPDEVSIYNDLGRADIADIRETMNTIPLKVLINAAAKDLGLKEFLGKSGTTGIAGAAYLVPDKIYDIMFRSAWANDLTGNASRVVDTPGSTLKVDYAKTGQYRPKRFGSGGSMPDESIETGQLTITPAIWGISTRVTNELIEDSQWDVVQMHLEEAAKACAQESSAQFVNTLWSASNGDGTVNSGNTGVTGVTDFADIMTGWAGNAVDGYISDTIITNPYAVADFASDASVTAYGSSYHDAQVGSPPMLTGTFKGMNIYTFTGEDAYGANVLYQSSKWCTLVYNKAEAALTVRKRWLKIDNYADPVKDLVGATITFREGYSTINKDAVFKLSEL
jgi:hypothetical protein